MPPVRVKLGKKTFARCRYGTPSETGKNEIFFLLYFILSIASFCVTAIPIILGLRPENEI